MKQQEEEEKSSYSQTPSKMCTLHPLTAQHPQTFPMLLLCRLARGICAHVCCELSLCQLTKAAASPQNMQRTKLQQTFPPCTDELESPSHIQAHFHKTQANFAFLKILPL